MIKKLAWICVFFFLQSANIFAQTHSGVVSTGYGFPSILRFIVNYEDKADIVQFKLKGLGPFHTKAEYIYKNRIGVGASAFYNTINFNFANKLKDTFKYQVRDFCLLGRLNFYAINNEKHQLYIGAGVGHLFFDNKIIRLTNPADTFLKVTPSLTLSNKMVLEATIGYRRKIYKNLNVYGELGLGRVIKQFAKNGAIDSYLQTGISYRFGNKHWATKKEKALPLSPRK